MDPRPQTAPTRIRSDVARNARVWNYWLGGEDNHPVDRAVLTHPTLELGGEGNEAAMRFWNENATPPITARGREEVASFLDGLEILEPGIVSCSRWRTNPREPEVAQFGVVARKP
ncbi:SAM-dependent methyltransferase [Streptomyces sp. NPDC058576]|uniref:SAM-dependent methyltransferase n=1 Tax=Streptomyces sp. NPDC058576 TaxID=3346547 RepID=UPI0036660D59